MSTSEVTELIESWKFCWRQKCPFWQTFLIHCNFMYCQALSICLSLNLSLSLRDRDRADTIITLYHHTTTTRNFLSTLELTYTQVWYIIAIVSSSPYDFHSEKIGLIRVAYDPPFSIRVYKYLKLLTLKCDTSFESSAQAQLISTQK